MQVVPNASNEYMSDTFLSDPHIWQVAVLPVAAVQMVAAELRNIFVLGTSFLLIFTSFHTLALLQTLDNGVKSPKNSLAVVYVVFGVTCSSAPCLLSLLGHRSFYQGSSNLFSFSFEIDFLPTTPSLISLPGVVWCWVARCTQFIVPNCSSPPSPSNMPAQFSLEQGLRSSGLPRCFTCTWAPG